MKISVSAPTTPVWPIGTVALVRKVGQSDNVKPFLRFHAADYNRGTDAPDKPARIVNLATGSVRYEQVKDYVVLKVYTDLAVS